MKMHNTKKSLQPYVASGAKEFVLWTALSNTSQEMIKGGATYQNGSGGSRRPGRRDNP